MIKILTTLNGEVVLDFHAKRGVTVDEVLEIAENEVDGGYADYARVEVDGEIYAEYES